MPPLNWFSWTIWALIIALQPALTILMIQRGSWRRWKALFCLLAAYSTESVTLLWAGNLAQPPELRSLYYFRVYWAMSAVTALLEVWVLVEICCNLVGISDRVRLWIRQGIPALALVYLIGSTILSMSTPMPFLGHLMQTVTFLDRAVTMAWLATFLTVALLAEFIGMEWTGESRGVAIGFAVNAASCMLASWLDAYFPDSPLVYILKGILYLCAIAVWGGTFLRGESPAVTLPSIDDLRAHQREHAEKLLQMLRGNVR